MFAIANKRPPGVMLYEETLELLHTVPEEQAGRIIKGIASFYVTGEMPTLTEPLEQAVATSIINSIIKDAEKYAEICEKRSQNIKSRWENQKQTGSKKEAKQKQTGSKGEANRFTPPTLEEVKAYCLESGYRIDAERFIDYYESNGWMVGRNKMKDWKAAVRNWSKRDDGKPKKDEYIDPNANVDLSWAERIGMNEWRLQKEVN